MSHILTQDIFLANIIFRTRNYFYFFQNCDFLPFVREGGPVAYGHLQLSILTQDIFLANIISPSPTDKNAHQSIWARDGAASGHTLKKTD